LPQGAEESIGILSVGHYDRCPRIGPHVASTGFIGTICLTSTRHQNGVLRIRNKLER
jgi:Ser-tRNA(Ala) deacylase AlaX